MRPTGQQLSATLHAILEALIKAFPYGISTTELLDRFGTCAKSRIGDLRDLGWRIHCTCEDSIHGIYRLETLAQGEPRITTWGFRATGSADRIEVKPYAKVSCTDVARAQQIADRVQALMKTDPILVGLTTLQTVPAPLAPEPIEPELDFFAELEQACNTCVRDVRVISSAWDARR